jgi:hypothetical protein
MSTELRSIHEYPEADGWQVHWKSQSFETACEIRDSISAAGNPVVVATGEPALPFATVSQRFRFTNDFPMSRWRLVGKEYSKRAAIRLRDLINQDGIEIACVAESWDSNLPWAVMAAERNEVRCLPHFR